MSEPSNVVAFSDSGFPEVGHASVHSPGVRLDGSRNEVWLCPAYSGGRTVMLYVKPGLTTRQVVAELVAAQVGGLLGLPCPRPFLVTVAPHLVGGARGKSLLTFGCEQVGPRSLARPIRDLDLMFESLQKAKLAERGAVLDELIANSVRGPGDVVFDLEGKVWFIDHEASLDGTVGSDRAVTNWLAFRLGEGQAVGERVALLEALRKAAAKIPDIRVGRMPPELGKLIEGQRIYRESMSFLSERRRHLDQLLSERVLPEQLYLPSGDANQNSNDSIGTTSV